MGEVKGFVKELFSDAVQEYWLPAVGIGLLALVLSIAGLIYANTLNSPETVQVFGQTVRCDSVLESSDSLGGRVMGALSRQTREAQEKCEAGALSDILKKAGIILLPLSIVWTAAWGWGGYKHDINAP